MKCFYPCELLNIFKNCKIVLKLRYANDNVGLQNPYILFAQWTLFDYTIAIYNFCTHSCKGYPLKIQTFHNKNRTKYNTKIKTKQNTKVPKCKNSNMTKYRRRKYKLQKYKCNKIQMEQNEKSTKCKYTNTMNTKGQNTNF